MHGSLLKKNYVILNWEEYFGCLSGNYIYFFKSVREHEYVDTYFIKDSKIEFQPDKPLEITLRNNFRTIYLKFPKIEKKEKWIKKLQERINQLKIYYDEINKNPETIIETVVDNNLINFDLELTIKTASFDIFERKSNNQTNSNAANNMNVSFFDIQENKSLDNQQQ